MGESITSTYIVKYEVLFYENQEVILSKFDSKNDKYLLLLYKFPTKNTIQDDVHAFKALWVYGTLQAI